MDKAKPGAPEDKSVPLDNEKPQKEFRGFADLGLLEPTRYGDWETKGRCSDF
ncbi:MAG: DUF1674 domain-containing protein [Alphaproteobacteria bacterium]